jgi:peptidoglycan/LPS O-acetylase OafA/YrhL
MGLIRILLAISVFLGHAWPLFPPKIHKMSGGVVSVRLFYIISGYLIAMVLSERDSSLKKFYISRALRILPTYLIILAVTFIISCVFIFWNEDPFLLGYFVGYKSMLSPTEVALLIIPQFGILFLDLFGFLGINKNGLQLILVSWGNTNGYEFLLIPQAWTLGIECWFYLLAPIILKKTWGPYALLSFSFCCSVLLLTTLPREIASNDPWSRRFFACELQYFAIGCIAYRFRNQLLPSTLSIKIIIYLCTLFCLASLDSPKFNIPPVLIYIGFALSIPSTISLSQFIPFDRFIGDLSYPFYLCHWLFLHLVYNEYLPSLSFPITTTLIYSLIASILIVLFIEKKINRKRKLLF